jgi:MYXO-CTERM domain-containing protein
VDKCAGVTCGAGQICQDGACHGSCADITCGAGELCVAGACKASPCATIACQKGTVCNLDTGACEADKCVNHCPFGSVCVPKTGACVADACQATQCPACSRCRIAYDGLADCVPDGTCASITIANRGGGCACTAAGGPDAAWPTSTWGILLGLIAVGRRRRRS